MSASHKFFNNQDLIHKTLSLLIGSKSEQKNESKEMKTEEKSITIDVDLINAVKTVNIDFYKAVAKLQKRDERFLKQLLIQLDERQQYLQSLISTVDAENTLLLEKLVAEEKRAYKNYCITGVVLCFSLIGTAVSGVYTGLITDTFIYALLFIISCLSTGSLCWFMDPLYKLWLDASVKTRQPQSLMEMSDLTRARIQRFYSTDLSLEPVLLVKDLKSQIQTALQQNHENMKIVTTLFQFFKPKSIALRQAPVLNVQIDIAAADDVKLQIGIN